MKRTRPRRLRNAYRDALWQSALLKAWIRQLGHDLQLDRLWREKMEGSPE